MENEARNESLFWHFWSANSEGKIEADTIQLSGNFGKIQTPKLRCVYLGAWRSAWLSVFPFLSPDNQSLQTAQD